MRSRSVSPSALSSRLRALVAAVAVALTAPLAPTQEVQRHGVEFETWVRDTFFDGYRPINYTQKWDIPAEANRRHGAVPVNPKAAKYNTPIDLGDALRQFDIDEPFILLIGYWRQHGPEKRFVTLIAPTVDPGTWRKLWGPITRADLEALDALIKDRTRTPQEVRRLAQAMKRRPPYNQGVIVLNPKIDTKGQRRLQCSLRFADVFTHLAPDSDPAPQAVPILWGVPFPGPVASAARTFTGDEAAPVRP